MKEKIFIAIISGITIFARSILIFNYYLLPVIRYNEKIIIIILDIKIYNQLEQLKLINSSGIQKINEIHEYCQSKNIK